MDIGVAGVAGESDCSERQGPIGPAENAEEERWGELPANVWKGYWVQVSNEAEVEQSREQQYLLKRALREQTFAACELYALHYKYSKYSYTHNQ